MIKTTGSRCRWFSFYSSMLPEYFIKHGVKLYGSFIITSQSNAKPKYFGDGKAMSSGRYIAKGILP